MDVVNLMIGIGTAMDQANLTASGRYVVFPSKSIEQMECFGEKLSEIPVDHKVGMINGITIFRDIPPPGANVIIQAGFTT